MALCGGTGVGRGDASSRLKEGRAGHAVRSRSGPYAHAGIAAQRGFILAADVNYRYTTVVSADRNPKIRNPSLSVSARMKFV